MDSQSLYFCMGIMAGILFLFLIKALTGNQIKRIRLNFPCSKCKFCSGSKSIDPYGYTSYYSRYRCDINWDDITGAVGGCDEFRGTLKCLLKARREKDE